MIVSYFCNPVISFHHFTIIINPMYRLYVHGQCFSTYPTTTYDYNSKCIAQFYHHNHLSHITTRASIQTKVSSQNFGQFGRRCCYLNSPLLWFTQLPRYSLNYSGRPQFAHTSGCGLDRLLSPFYSQYFYQGQIYNTN